MPSPVNLNEYEALACERLPPTVYDYFAQGANDEITLSENRVSWQRLRLRPKVLVGVIVSNHGGRQLDGVASTCQALPEVAEAVGGRAAVLVDGGIRRGTDVLKALALGARAVIVGRPYLWGLAVDGEAGVNRVLELLRQEITLAMGLAGRPAIREIDRTLLG